MAKAKHSFKVVVGNDASVRRDYVEFECDRCFQDVYIDRQFMELLLSGQPLIPFALKALDTNSCNKVRDAIILDLPEVPMCKACQKRPVSIPGSRGIEGALCLPCYYDL